MTFRQAYKRFDALDAPLPLMTLVSLALWTQAIQRRGAQHEDPAGGVYGVLDPTSSLCTPC